MECLKCRFQSPEGMKFCGMCGSLLPVRCPSCGHSNDPSASRCARCRNRLEAEALPSYARRSPRDYTPPFLAEKVLQLRSSIQGERKIVSVLFADVAGFTGISESLDPEEVREIMDGCFEILGQEIHGVGGTINQYMGDGIMALFGAPIAYEDHTRRACHAALEIQRRMRTYASSLEKRYGIDFQMRIGIHTGQVVVGAIGDNLRLDYTAVGDTTNLASRLESLAPPGGILVSAAIRRDLRREFRFRSMGLLAVKGKSSPVEAFLLLEGGEGFHGKEADQTPFMDREQELSILQENLNMALQHQPRIVMIEGEVGVGKTRLLSEFRASIADKDLTSMQGRCKPYGKAMAFHPVVEMFRTFFRGAEKGNSGMPGVKDRRILSREAVIPGFEQVIDLSRQTRKGDESSEVLLEGRKRLAFRKLRDLLHAMMEERPLLLTFDDMQWADPTTSEFLAYFLQSLTRGPCMIVCVGRDLPDPWCPGVSHQSIRLSPLPWDPARNILNSVLGTDLLDSRASQKILDRAAGNPLFLVEIGANLKSRGLIDCDLHKCRLQVPVEELDIPDNVRGVLAARLDALPEDQKRVVQIASIIGTEFSRSLLETLIFPEVNLISCLSTLEERGIFQKISSGNGSSYGFHHQMMRDVAYQSLLRSDRRKYHLLAAEGIEHIYRDNLGDYVPMLAYHYYTAEDWPKALAYTLEAAETAKQAYACREALTCYDRALDILRRGKWDHPHEKALLLYKWKGAMDFCVGRLPESRASFQKMLSESRRYKDLEAETEALFRLGWIGFYSHQPRAALSYLVKASETAHERNLSEIRLKAVSFLGFVYAVLGRLNEARPLLVEALHLSEAVNKPEGRAWSVSHLIQYYNWIGEFGKALALSEELRRLNDKIKSPYFNILLHFREGLIYGALGRLDEAKSVLQAGLDRLEIGDDRFWSPRFLNTLGWVYAEEGDIENALRLNQESLKEALTTGNPETIHNAEINLAENYTAKGELEKAGQILDKAWGEIRRPGAAYTRWRYKTRVMLALADLYRVTGKRKKGLEFAARALETARRTGARKHESRALQLRGNLLVRNRSEAIKCLNQALSLSEGMGTRKLSERIKRDMEALDRSLKTG